MCGIVGYVGKKQAQEILLEGLAGLEYRGYDSSGICVADPAGRLKIVKAGGRLSVIEKRLAASPLEGTAGIGHTRWATHGEPSDENAHPRPEPVQPREGANLRGQAVHCEAH